MNLLYYGSRGRGLHQSEHMVTAKQMVAYHLTLIESVGAIVAYHLTLIESVRADNSVAAREDNVSR